MNLDPGLTPPPNGQPKQVPALIVGWDAETQNVGVKFDPKDFKTWDFILAVLEMAKRSVETSARMAQLQQMQQRSQEAARDEALRKLVQGR